MKKVVAVFAALDGCGGAGLLADCRAVLSAGCRPLAVATGVSAQNLDAFYGLWRVPPDVVGAQFSALASAEVAAVKVGMLGGNAAIVGKCIKQTHQNLNHGKNKNPPAPVVWDPVLAATAPVATIADNATVASIIKGAGKKSLTKTPPATINTMRRHIAPHVFVATPNRAELSALTATKTIKDGLRVMFADGVQNVLITGIGEKSGKLRHCLYGNDDMHAPKWEVICDKRRGVFHGSGCLFSSLLAAYLARGVALTKAAARANDKTLAAIDKAIDGGKGIDENIRGWGMRQKILP